MSELKFTNVSLRKKINRLYILAIDLERSSAVAFVSYITETKVAINVGKNHATDVIEPHLIERKFDSQS